MADKEKQFTGNTLQQNKFEVLPELPRGSRILVPKTKRGIKRVKRNEEYQKKIEEKRREKQRKAEEERLEKIKNTPCNIWPEDL